MAISWDNDEFIYWLDLETIPNNGRCFILDANIATLKNLAKRYNFIDFTHLNVSIHIQPSAHNKYYTLKADLTSKIQRACVISLEPVHETVQTDFQVVYVKESSDQAYKGKKKLKHLIKNHNNKVNSYILDTSNLDTSNLDTSNLDTRERFIIGEKIDLGAICLEHFTLALDDYPRAQDKNTDTLIEFISPRQRKYIELNGNIKKYTAWDSLYKNKK